MCDSDTHGLVQISKLYRHLVSYPTKGAPSYAKCREVDLGVILEEEDWTHLVMD